ncbi:Clavaminate synthase-like protein [Melanomma pulvis-pyrius CBS 109.77]|uniref:Clavaminate synthase-like protein n=1 Tax=Melanomma pulvis-pyrius CBS 109.77 TaxID=1314802 RepID=A0A6A6WRQ1_9PLEO|nr:Clavaminate synthase-like protein [Melanomma pulvis-pyrius CBS 109.77]
MASLEAKDTSIPVIDISSPSPEVAQQVLLAASTFGFLFIKNDGVTIPPADIDTMFELSRKFFKSSVEEKSEYAIHSDKAGGKNRGWVAMQGESLDPEGQKLGDPKEAFNIAPPHPTLQPLPSPLTPSAPLISTFQTSCHTLCKQILSLLALGLQIPDPEYFTSRHDQSLGLSGSIFRMLYYPATPAEQGTEKEGNETESVSVLAGAHSDYGTLTLLFRLPGQPGLEILPAGSSAWSPIPVNPSPTAYAHPPILVNIGDLLSFWTSGLLKSTVHRVAFTNDSKEGRDERYSMAYFCHPQDDVMLEGVPSPIVKDFAGKGEGDEELERQRVRLGFGGEGGEVDVLTAKQHLDRRLRVTYGLKD